MTLQLTWHIKAYLIYRIFSLAEYKPLLNIQPSQAQPREGRCMTVTVKVCRGFTSRCKPAVTLRHRQARKHLKSLSSSRKNSLERWIQDEPVAELCEEKEKKGSYYMDKHINSTEHTTSFVRDGSGRVMAWAITVWLPVELCHWCLLVM